MRRVLVDEAQVSDWARRWPCFGDAAALTFEFDAYTGDLVDIEGETETMDGAGVAALAEDARAGIIGRDVTGVRGLLITADEAADIRARSDAYDKWAKRFRKPNGWTVIPADAVAPVTITNDERGKLEQFEVWRDLPERLFAYVRQREGGPHERRASGEGPFLEATTWTGDVLGFATWGEPYISGFGDRRRSIAVGINGYWYEGTAYVSAGDYCRLRKRGRINAPWTVKYDRRTRSWGVYSAGKVSYTVTAEGPDYGKRLWTPPNWYTGGGGPGKAGKADARRWADDLNARRLPSGAFNYQLEQAQ